jgi:predicted CoA-binding protein
MTHDSYGDDYIRGILRDSRVFAMVGASSNPIRPSYFAMKYLLGKGYRVIPVNPGQAGKELLGQPIHASLRDISEPVDVVDIFRNAEAALEITREAIAIGAKVVWMQLGVRNDEAARLAEEAGLKVVMNRSVAELGSTTTSEGPPLERGSTPAIAPGQAELGDFRVATDDHPAPKGRLSSTRGVPDRPDSCPVPLRRYSR